MGTQCMQLHWVVVVVVVVAAVHVDAVVHVYAHMICICRCMLIKRSQPLALAAKILHGL